MVEDNSTLFKIRPSSNGVGKVSDSNLVYAEKGVLSLSSLLLIAEPGAKDVPFEFFSPTIDTERLIEVFGADLSLRKETFDFRW